MRYAYSSSPRGDCERATFSRAGLGRWPSASRRSARRYAEHLVNHSNQLTSCDCRGRWGRAEDRRYPRYRPLHPSPRPRWRPRPAAPRGVTGSERSSRLAEAGATARSHWGANDSSVMRDAVRRRRIMRSEDDSVVHVGCHWTCVMRRRPSVRVSERRPYVCVSERLRGMRVC
jgi:hypothetical protein